MIPAWKQRLNRRGKQHKIFERFKSNYQWRQARSEMKRRKNREQRNRMKRAKRRNVGNQFKVA